MTGERIFLDTNFLVYRADQNSPVKMEIAKKIFNELAEQNRAVISTQVLQEFYNTATKKLKIDPVIVKELVHSLPKKLETITLHAGIIERGIDVSIQYKISFWDGLIAAAAETANCSKIYTEDLADGQIIRGVKIENPFKI